MSSDSQEHKQDTNPQKQDGNKRETIIASIICGIVLLVPMIFIEHEYDLFTKEYGEAKEGAAGSALALASLRANVNTAFFSTTKKNEIKAKKCWL